MNVNVEQAVKLIADGETVAIPTETVYGLAADALNINAVKKIFQQKERPADNPLIVHISNLDQLYRIANNIPEDAEKLADKFWPGPLSIVLDKQNIVPDIVTGGLGTVAVRMPDHSLTLSLIEKAGPLTAPSANKSGRPSPTHPKHVIEDFGMELPVLDGGPSKLGLESTVVDLSGDEVTILRPGFIDAEMIEKVLGVKVTEDQSGKSAVKKSPGTRFTHYKPKASVLWFDVSHTTVDGRENYYIFHRERKIPPGNNVHSYRGDYEAMARDLYDHFRTADHLSCPKIYVEPFNHAEKHPLIPALQDRIEKAISS